MDSPAPFTVLRFAWVALGAAGVFLGWWKGRRGAAVVGALLGLMWLAQPYLMSPMSVTAITGLGQSLVLSRQHWTSGGIFLWMSLLATLVAGLTVLVLLFR